MKKIFILLFILFIASINVGTQESNPLYLIDPNQPTNPIILNSIGPVIHDGVISPDEYEYTVSPYFVNKHGIVMDLQYTINRSIIYIAFTANVGGWISIGFDYSDDMKDSDMIVGWYNEITGTTIVSDKWGATEEGMPGSDIQQDILSYAGSQITSPSNTTTIEFSRYLDTGDTLQDNEIIPGVGIKMLWAVHESADMYTPATEHTEEGEYKDSMKNKYLTFYGSPSTPKNLSANSENENQVGLSWIASAGDGGFAITSYNIYRSMFDRTTSSWLPYSMIASTTSTNSYTDTSITPGENYTYSVTAENSKGESGYSNEVGAFPYGNLTPPQNVMASSGNWQVDLSWQYPLSDGGVSVDQYYILKSETSGGPYELIGQTNQMQFVDDNVINGFTYFYAVYSENRLSTSSLSNEVIAIPVGDPSSPTNVGLSYGNNNVSLSWDIPITDGGFTLSGFNVYRSDSINGTYNFVGSSAVTSYLDISTVNANTYYYVISATNSFGESAYSSAQQITLAHVPNISNNLRAATKSGNITLTWSNADGLGYEILNYYIYRSTKINGKYNIIANVTGNAFVDTNIVKGTTYYYKITARNEIGEASFSTIVSGTPSSVPSALVNLQVTIGLDRIKISWSEVDDNGGFIISYYLVYRSNGNGYDLIGLAYPKEYVDKNVLPGITYSYKITAVNRIGKSSFSSSIAASLYQVPDVPIGLTTEIKQNGILLSWPSQSNDTKINIYRSTISGEPYSLVTTTSDENYLDMNIVFGYTYYYVITHVNGEVESRFSAEVDVTPILPPSTPRNLIGLAGNGQSVLVWESPTFDGGNVIEFYNIYRSNAIDGDYVLANTSSAVMYIDETVENNFTYYYSVSAVTQVGESVLTEAISIKPSFDALEFEIISVEDTSTSDTTDLNSTNDDISDDIQSSTISGITEVETLELQPGVITWTSSVILGSAVGMGGLNLIAKKVNKP